MFIVTLGGSKALPVPLYIQFYKPQKINHSVKNISKKCRDQVGSGPMVKKAKL